MAALEGGRDDQQHLSKEQVTSTAESREPNGAD